MPELKKCRACGVDIPSNAPFGHCPQCLLAIGFGPIPKEVLESPEGPPLQSAIGNRQSPIATVRYFGDYELLEEIGRGGMGVVFKARQISLRRLVALKMMSAGELASPTAVQRFHVEAEAAAKLDHPNIVPIYEIGVHQGQHYFSMKLVEGESLERWRLKPDSPSTDRSHAKKGISGPAGQYSVSNAVRLVAAIARAIHYAHQHGIIHRDLKPANILLDAQGEPHLTDFGLAKILEHEIGVTRTAEVMGTPSYMSPEQAAGRQLSTATDIWSLGVVFYELLTGYPPFRAENTPALLRKIAEEEPAPPSQHLRSSRREEAQAEEPETRPAATGAKRGENPKSEMDQGILTSAAARVEKIDRDLETICLKCLEKDPARRYASAAALADDLEHWLRHEPILARRASVFERVVKWAQRQPVLAAAVVLLNLVLAAGLAGILWQWRHAVVARRAEAAAHQRAVRAEADALARLHEANLNYVRANRLTARPGQRFDSLAELAHAAARTNSLDLRNQAIACLVLPDLRPNKRSAKPDWHSFKFDASYRRYATNDGVGNLTIRDTKTDAMLAQLPVQATRHIGSLAAFSPDDLFVATIDKAGQGRIWSWPAQTPRLINLPRDAALLAFTPDGRALVVKHADGSLHFLSATNSADERSFAGPASLTWGEFHFDPSGEKFLTCNKGQVVIRRASDGGHLKILIPPEGATAGLERAAWHPDGRRVACAWRNHIGLWDVETGRQLAVFEGHDALVVGLAFTRTGQYFASASWDNTTRLWDADTHREAWILPESGNYLSISSDDRWLSFETWNGQEVKLYELADLTAAQRFTVPPPTPAPGTVHFTAHAVFSPDGELLLTRDEDGIYVFDPPQPAPVAVVPVGREHYASPAPDGKALFTGGSRGARRWPMRWSADRSELHLGPPEVLEATRGLKVDGVFLSRDGQWLVARGGNDTALACHLESPFEVVHFDRRILQDSYPFISPDGRWIATVSRNHLKIWSGRTGGLVTNLPTLLAGQPAFSPDGRWVVCSQRDSTAVWEIADWSLRRRIAHPSEYGTRPLALSPNGRMLAICVSDHEFRLFSFETGEELATLPAGRLMTSLCFSLAGDRLAVAYEPGHIQLWDLRRLREQLASLHLDWDLPPFPPQQPAGASRPLRVIVHTNTVGQSHRDTWE